MPVVPSSIALAGAEIELAPLEQRERRLSRLVREIAPEYDYILVDSPPSLGLLTVNALTAADSVLIPIQCEYYALEGLTQLIATINENPMAKPKNGARTIASITGRSPDHFTMSHPPWVTAAPTSPPIKA